MSLNELPLAVISERDDREDSISEMECVRQALEQHGVKAVDESVVDYMVRPHAMVIP